jgi:4-hydroxybenzoate polyprenyltransferase
MWKLQNYFRLIRLERGVSASLGVILTGIIVGDFNHFQIDYLFSCIAVLFAATANFVLNDICDINADKINNRTDRPLAQGEIKIESAKSIVIVSSFVALFMTLFLKPVPRIMILLGLPLSLAYNIYLKRYLILKNIFTGLANIGVILLGALISDMIVESIAFYIAIISFFFSFSYEIMLDIADMKGDKELGVETLPNRIGPRKTAWLSVLIGIGAIIFNPLPYFIKIDPRLYRDVFFLCLILLPIFNRLNISRALIEDQTPSNILKLKKRLFRNLQLGGLCYLIGFII